MKTGMQIQFGSENGGRLSGQVSLEPESMKTQIAAALVRLVSGFKKIKYVEFDKVRLFASDFNDTELPAAQFIDNLESVTHERTRMRNTWNITLEIVDKSDENGYLSQKDMWNLSYQIARAIWAEPQLGIKGVIQATYLSNQTDLHLLEPYYLLRLDLSVEYYENLTGNCC